MKNIGLFYALLAYFLWGLFPVFWIQLNQIDSLQVVMHRMVWSCLLAVSFIVFTQQWRECLAIIKQKYTFIRLFLSSMLISVNWAAFIWATQNGKITEASMGYFIAPLLSLFLGVLLFKERVSRAQLLSVVLVAIAVLYLIFAYGQPPYLALTLAASFSCYGAIKKSITIPAIQGMGIETAFMLIPASIYLIYIEIGGRGVFGHNTYTDSLLILGGVFTLIPLLLFSASAKKLSLTTLGMIQFLGPSIQLVVAVFLYKEPFFTEQIISFGLIWCALVIYSYDQYFYQPKSAC